jgi:multicomponent Na+:H+ antiporter subunit G
MMEFVSQAEAIFHTVRFPLGAALCLIGAVLAMIGAVGVIRFPDFYTRLHGASVTETSGVTVLLLGMAFLAPHWTILLKLGVMWLFLFITSPTASHAVANAAYVAGLQPLTGRFGPERDEGDIL